MADIKYENVFPELYYDIISRLVPGSLVIYMYTNISDNWVTLIKLIPVAYVIGVILDILSNITIHVPFDRLMNKIHNKHLTDYQLWTRASTGPSETARIYKKKLAEIIFFRSLLCFVLLQIAISMLTGIKPNLPAKFPPYYPTLTCIFVIFLACFYRAVFFIRRDQTP